MINEQFKGASWFIEAHITKCLDSINHQKLMCMLGRQVLCKKTLALIQSRLKTAHVQMGDLIQKAMDGTPVKHSVLSPVLCNVFFHEFDKFMFQLSQQHHKSPRETPAYTKLGEAIGNTCSLNENIGQQLCKTRTADIMHSNFIRVQYVRYADDFLIAVIGPRRLALHIKNLVAQFLQNQLALD